MRFLRTASTRRLLAALAGLLVAIAAGTAIAVAASSSGPVPKHERLAVAVRAALAAPAVQGISANITFTNHLIDASSLQGSDPILTGATGRLWLAKNRLRLELQSPNGDAQVVVNGRSFWISEPSSHTVYEGTLPADLGQAGKATDHGAAGHKADTIPSIAQIQTELTKLMQHADVSGATPTDVGGQPAYTVSIGPKHDGGLLGSAQLAWDAIRGVPLRIAVYARGNATPVLELKADNVSYGAVPASNFAVSPPAGSKVVKIASGSAAAKAGQAGQAGQAKRSGQHGRHAAVHGLAAVKAKLPFSLVAPSSLVGLPRHSATLLDWGGKPAALVTYGQGLGGIAVIEQTAGVKTAAAKTTKSSSQGDSGQSGLSLPTVSINGATGTELDTALGTVVHFTRNGFAYTVVGSLPSAAADAAARAL
ncbi:MAG: LolA family protein [Solirubrobacteraceae bacterium]